MNTDFWEQFYQNNKVTLEPTTFARHVVQQISKIGRIIDLGCGNGRDSLFFAREGFKVLALDQVEVSGLVGHDNIKFQKINFKDIGQIHLLHGDLLYARFLFHAIPSDLLSGLLNWGRGRLFAEFRAFGDVPQIYPNHERVFWKAGDFVDLLSANNFRIISFDEARGRAAYLGEDPLVFRLEAIKEDKN